MTSEPPRSPLPTGRNAPPAMRIAHVGIGANLGDALATVKAAIEALRPLGLQRCSSLYRSAPQQAKGPDFVNAVALLHSALAPEALLAELQAIERHFGRQRPYHHAPRTLDLDLLLLGNEVCNSARLTLPHPRLAQRAFVLQPLLELSPTLQVPGLGALSPCLAATATQAIQRIEPPPTMHS